MAKIDEAKYEEMIAALKSFALNVSNAASSMKSVVSNCATALGSEDNAVPEITKSVNLSVKQYLMACKEALRIAKLMQDELDEQRKEDKVWNEQE